MVVVVDHQLSYMSNGTVDLIATISNSCNQTVTKSVKIVSGAPKSFVKGSVCEHANLASYIPCNLTASYTNYGSVLGFDLGYQGFDYYPNYNADFQWENISNNFYFFAPAINLSSATTISAQTVYIRFNNAITPNMVQFRGRARNNCGWGEWRSYTWVVDSTIPTYTPPPPSPPVIIDKYYKTTTNSSVPYASISLIDPKIVPNTISPIIAKLFSLSGIELSSIQIINNSGSFYIGGLVSNYYLVKIYFDSHTEGDLIVKY